jgi:hypothetical protein
MLLWPVELRQLLLQYKRIYLSLRDVACSDSALRSVLFASGLQTLHGVQNLHVVHLTYKVTLCLVMKRHEDSRQTQYLRTDSTGCHFGYHYNTDHDRHDGHHHHQITKLSHSINAIGPAPHRGGRKREHRSARSTSNLQGDLVPRHEAS